MSNDLSVWGISSGAIAESLRDAKAAFLEKQGWTEEMLARYGLTVCPNNIDGFWNLRYQPQLQGYNYLDIPFFGLDGDPIVAYPARAGIGLPFRRARLLGFRGSSGKYQSYPESGVRIYLPRDLTRPDFWVDAAFNLETPIVITEGELDSIAAHQAGMACLGLSGVDCFMERGGKTIAEPGGDILWQSRKVYICYDQDEEATLEEPFKPGVMAGLQRLITHLSALGASVELLYIIQTETGRSRMGEKLGLSEYFKHGGTVAGLMTTAVKVEEAPDMILAKYLTSFAMHYNIVYDLKTGLGKPFHEWASHHTNSVVTTVGAEGKVSRSSVPEVWKRHRLRPTIERFIFDIKVGFGLQPGTHDFNMWRGWGTAAGEWSDGAGGKVEAVDYFEEWSRQMWGEHWPWVRGLLKHLLVRPDVLRPHALVLQTPAKGIGKSTWFRLLRELVGEDLGIVLTQEQYSNHFNALMDGKMVVQMDEVYFYKPTEARAIMEHITSDTIIIEGKGMNQVPKPWRGLLCMTTNEPFAVKTGAGERRIMQNTPVIEEEEKGEWLGKLTEVILPALLGPSAEAISGREAVMGWLVDGGDWLADYDLNRPAPTSKSLTESIVTSRSEREALAYEVYEALPELYVLDASMYRAFKDRGFDKYVYDKVRLLSRSRAAHVLNIGGRILRVLVCHKSMMLPTREDARGVEVFGSANSGFGDIETKDLKAGRDAVLAVLGGL